MGANSNMKSKKKNNVWESFLRYFHRPAEPSPAEENVTSSAITVEEVTGSHVFNIERYSVQKLNAKGRFLQSSTFSVGGYDWHLMYYPNGDKRARNGCASIYLKCNAPHNVAAQWTYTVLNQKGTQLWKSCKSNIYTFNNTKSNSWGYSNFLNKWVFESGVRKDDCLLIKCTVTIIKESVQKCVL
ncbi:hypothetical protein LUZ61_013268 [Rhynchospora tenuis]|uniref:MATH domain-containing protein n=1 Tax=Rhynchospora tenuis TaxID=198213 RepID=A0AAD5W987_9POAL|nr:hypothetical protein LUZ61_013268 [Rhynchospora tenuis]